MDFSETDLKKIIYFLVLLTIVKTQESCRTPSFEDGYCVHYRECPFVAELNKRFGLQLPQYFKDYLIKSKCSQDNEPIRLCCKILNYKPKPVVPDAMDNRFNVDLDTNRDITNQVNTAGFNILNDLDCGKTDGNRVAGGNETDLAEYPWMALLRYDVPDNPFLCGGSLITNRYVLTATHCVNRRTMEVQGVRLGEHDLLANEDCKIKGGNRVCNPPVEDFGVEQIIMHPDYSERKRINDIALIKLDRNVDFKRHIQPICLPITEDALKLEIEDDDFYIAGWGSTEKGAQSTVLLKARVAHQERSQCQNAYGIDITHRHLCAGDLVSGRDTCRGDSGGPLLLFSKFKRFKRFIQYGVVASGGTACNLSQALPGIYTNIVNFLPWITDNIVV